MKRILLAFTLLLSFSVLAIAAPLVEADIVHVEKSPPLPDALFIHSPVVVFERFDDVSVEIVWEVKTLQGFCKEIIPVANSPG